MEKINVFLSGIFIGMTIVTLTIAVEQITNPEMNIKEYSPIGASIIGMIFAIVFLYEERIIRWIKEKKEVIYNG